MSGASQDAANLADASAQEAMDALQAFTDDLDAKEAELAARKARLEEDEEMGSVSYEQIEAARSRLNASEKTARRAADAAASTAEK